MAQKLAPRRHEKKALPVEGRPLGVRFVAAMIIALMILSFASFFSPQGEIPLPTPTPTSSFEPVNSLLIVDTQTGTGATASDGKKVIVNYTGRLNNKDGVQFDSTSGSTPFTFQLGSGEVIEGWDKGIAGMKVGGKRELTIPANLGYGSEDFGTIPANSTLFFEVELLAVE